MSTSERQPNEAIDAEASTSDQWEGPFPEYDKYGCLTGAHYVRCRDCRREVLTGRKAFLTHADGCRFED